MNIKPTENGLIKNTDDEKKELREEVKSSYSIKKYRIQEVKTWSSSSYTSN